MSDNLAVAENRVVHESPVHGPEILEELKRLRLHEQEILKAWAADDHEARMLRFDLAEIETAAKIEGRPAIAQMAAEARGKSADRKTKVLRLLDALGALAIPDDSFRWMPAGSERDELQAAYDAFKAGERR